MKNKVKFIPAFVWFIVVSLLLSLPGSAFPQQSLLAKFQFDKFVHIGLFALLVFLFFLPFSRQPIAIPQKRKILLTIASFGILYGTIMEFVQKYWIPYRSFDIWDIVADGIGGFLPLLFFRKIVQ